MGPASIEFFETRMPLSLEMAETVLGMSEGRRPQPLERIG